jgi:hypothetical protein
MYCHDLGVVRVIYKTGFDWMIIFIDSLYIQLGPTGNTALYLTHTLCSSHLHRH